MLRENQIKGKRYIKTNSPGDQLVNYLPAKINFYKGTFSRIQLNSFNHYILENYVLRNEILWSCFETIYVEIEKFIGAGF